MTAIVDTSYPLSTSSSSSSPSSSLSVLSSNLHLTPDSASSYLNSLSHNYNDYLNLYILPLLHKSKLVFEQTFLGTHVSVLGSQLFVSQSPSS